LENSFEDCNVITIEQLRLIEIDVFGHFHKRSLVFATDHLFRIDVNNFIHIEEVSLDATAIDSILDSLMPSYGAMPVSGIDSFISFPQLKNYSWNSYMMESYCRHLSERYHFVSFYPILGKHNDNSSNVGAIVDSKHGNDYFDVLATVVSSVNIELTASSVGTYLSEMRYISRKKDEMIYEIISRAKLLKGGFNV
jgi:hypothetical protein